MCPVGDHRKIEPFECADGDDDGGGADKQDARESGESERDSYRPEMGPACAFAASASGARCKRCRETRFEV